MAGLLAVLSTGCLRAYQDLTLNQDDTIDGTIVFAVDRDLLELSGQSVDDFMKEVTGDNAGIPAGIEFETEPYDEDGFVGERFTFTGAPLDGFDGSGGPEELSITRQGETFVVAGTFDATGDRFDPSTMPGGEGLLDTFDVQVSVTFPGAVTSHNGELDGTTVRWKLGLGQLNEIEAVGSAIGSGGSGDGAGVLVWVLLGIAIVAGIALVALLIASRRKAGSPAAPVPSEPVPGDAPSDDVASVDASRTVTAPMSGVPSAGASSAAPPAPVPVPPPAPVPVDEPASSEPVAPPDTEPLASDPGTPDQDGPGDAGATGGSAQPSG
ncbi:MAG: LppM family (lipo)protein [Actinomycetota bacterium]